jgi:hypothetical protein
MAMALRIAERESGYESKPAEWREFLKLWAARLTESLAAHRRPYNPKLSAVFDASPEALIANQRQITQLELKFDLSLPQSYRDFLLAGGSAFQFGADDDFETGSEKFFSCAEITWFHEYLSEAMEAIGGQFESYRGESEDDVYYRYGYAEQGNELTWDRHLTRLLVVGHYVGGVLLLSPNETTKDGEWEAHERWPDQAIRHLNFAEMMRNVFYCSVDTKSQYGSPAPNDILDKCCNGLLTPRIR